MRHYSHEQRLQFGLRVIIRCRSDQRCERRQPQRLAEAWMCVCLLGTRRKVCTHVWTCASARKHCYNVKVRCVGCTMVETMITNWKWFSTVIYKRCTYTECTPRKLVYTTPCVSKMKHMFGECNIPRRGRSVTQFVEFKAGTRALCSIVIQPQDVRNATGYQLTVHQISKQLTRTWSAAQVAAWTVLVSSSSACSPWSEIRM